MPVVPVAILGNSGWDLAVYATGMAATMPPSAPTHGDRLNLTSSPPPVQAESNFVGSYMRPLQCLSSNEPSTGSEDVDLSSFDRSSFIFGLSNKFINDGNFNHYKLSLSEVLPSWFHACVTPLVTPTGDLQSWRTVLAG